MGTGTDRDLDTAQRLRQLARHSRLISRARGVRFGGKVPLVASAAALAPIIAMVLTREQSGFVMWSVVGLVALLSVSVQLVSDRVDALLELLERSGAIGLEPDPRDRHRSGPRPAL